MSSMNGHMEVGLECSRPGLFQSDPPRAKRVNLVEVAACATTHPCSRAARALGNRGDLIWSGLLPTGWIPTLEEARLPEREEMGVD